MNLRNRTIVIAEIVLVCLAATSLHAASKEEQQQEVGKMVQQSLQQLYQAQPLAKVAVEHAAGYAVFSDWGVKILFGGSGNGTGLAVNNKTHQKTYMKMVEMQAGLGFGVSKFRNIFVFETQEALQKFINSGWEFGGQATAAAKSTTKGGAMSGAASVADGVWLYQLTEKGLNVSVTATGAKYYKDDKLN